MGGMKVESGYIFILAGGSLLTQAVSLEGRPRGPFPLDFLLLDVDNPSFP